MNVTLDPGTYIVAVSGGVDSMVLLHLLSSQPGLRLTVAHFDHGMRDESAADLGLVRQLAREYGLPFIYGKERLGAGASEEAARLARYEFLHKVREAAGAQAIITAHHKDDLLETAIINMVRGTGRKGLTSLRSTDTIVRPLLHIPKAVIRQYAAEQGLVWREDASNSDMKYLRNHIRHVVLPRLQEVDKARMHQIISKLHDVNHELDASLGDYIDEHSDEAGRLDRKAFTLLPHVVAREVLASWLRRNGVRDFDTKTLERLVLAAKTKAAGKRANVCRETWMTIDKNTLALAVTER